MTIIEFKAIYPPTSLKRHRHSKYGKHTYDPSSKEKSDFVSKIKTFIPPKPIEGPIKAILNFYEKRPKSHYRTGKLSELLKKNAPKINTSKRDIDNFVKFVLDALNKKMYLDDSQIFEIVCGKYYSDSEGYIECKFEEVNEIEDNVEVKNEKSDSSETTNLTNTNESSNIN